MGYQQCLLTVFGNYNLQSMQMKPKLRLNSHLQHKRYAQADDSEYHAHQNETTASRAERRFFTSKHEEIDRQDNVSACLSIEKELPELSIRPSQNCIVDQNVALQNLMNENKLKEEALNKASKMIGLMEEENAQLNAKIQQLEVMITERDGLIESLENELKLNTSQDKNLSKDILTERNRHTVPLDLSKSQKKTPREEKVRSKSDLFFNFTYSKQKQGGVRRSQNKIFLGDNPTFKQLKQINMSKKLSPYTSKNIIKNTTENGENPLSTIMTQQLAIMVVQEEIDNSRYLSDELGELLTVELEEYLEFQNQLERIQRDLLDYQEQESMAASYVKIVSKNIVDPQGLAEDYSKTNIIQQYQTIIYDYRQYSAFLKSYLCESLNFIYSISASFSQSLPLYNLTSFLKKASKEIIKKMNNRSTSLIEENRQLKNIIEQLIKNIELTRKKQITVRSWNEFELPLNNFQ